MPAGQLYDALFRALGEGCRDGVLVHDGARIGYVNSALQRLLGFHGAGDLVGRPLTSIVYPDDLPRLRPADRSGSDAAQTTVELRCLARDGSVLTVEATGSACEVGAVRAFVVVVRDVTCARIEEDALRRSHDELEGWVEQRSAELASTRASLLHEVGLRRQAELALQQRDGQLHQALKMEAVGRLAGGIAHDFNNLLSVILSYSHLVQLTLPEGSPLREPLSEMKRAAERGAELTHQLLAFSRRQVLEPKVIDPSDVVADMDKLLQRVVGEDLQLRVLRTPELSQIRVDRNQLEQVLLNLAVNARDAMPGGGQLTIEMADVQFDADYARRYGEVAAGKYVMIAVSDTGVGMDRATIARAFEPFFTTKSREKGTGLGLSIIHGIVKQSGGHVRVKSELGRGTTFKLYFPVAEGPVESLPPPLPRAVASAGQETVLLVEDNPSVLGLIRTLLRRAGYHVLSARTPRAALALSARYQGPIALLLADVVMPQMSGPRLAQALESHHPRMRVMYMSGYTDDALDHHGVLTSAWPLLQKPFTPDALLAKVGEVLLEGPRAAAG